MGNSNLGRVFLALIAGLLSLFVLLIPSSASEDSTSTQIPQASLLVGSSISLGKATQIAAAQPGYPYVRDGDISARASLAHGDADGPVVPGENLTPVADGSGALADGQFECGTSVREFDTISSRGLQ